MKKILFILILFFLNIYFTDISFASSLKINEFFPHPLTGNKEWVEFYNPDNLDLLNYYLDDDPDFTSDSGSSSKKSLSEINNSNLLYPYFECSSFLNNDGDYVVLFSPTGEIIDQYKYENDYGSEVSIGRSPDGVGEITVLSNSTKGCENSLPPTLTPTLTPTFTVTPSPTKTPTATNTKSPTKTPTPTRSSNTTKLVTTLTFATTTTTVKSNNIYKTVTTKKTLVLGKNIINIGTSSATLTPTKKIEKVIVKGKNNLFPIFTIIGGVFMVICGILGYLFYKKKKNNL